MQFLEKYRAMYESRKMSAMQKQRIWLLVESSSNGDSSVLVSTSLMSRRVKAKLAIK